MVSCCFCVRFRQKERMALRRGIGAIFREGGLLGLLA